MIFHLFFCNLYFECCFSCYNKIGDAMTLVDRYLKRNGVTREELESKVDTNLQSQIDIDWILDYYKITSSRALEMVSIADIVGYDYSWMPAKTSSLLDSYSNFFDDSEYADGYHSRSLSLLLYPIDTLLSHLQSSFQREPMKGAYASRGKYIITDNGLHRYTVLRTAYLVALMQTKTEEEREKLREKYRIPMEVRFIDFPKTYANYILRKLGVTKWLSKDSNGRTKLTFQDNTVKVLTDEELFLLVGSILKQNPEFLQALIKEAPNHEKMEDFLKVVVPEFFSQKEEKKNNGNIL